MGFIGLKEYGEKHGKNIRTVRDYAIDGRLKTAKKIARDWIVDEDEPWPVKKRNRGSKNKD